MVNIVSPRPPLNLFEIVRGTITADWTTVYDVPFYVIPAVGPTPQQTVQTAAIITGLIATPQGGVPARVSIRFLATNDAAFPLIEQAYAPENDFLSVVLDRQVIKSGERLQMKVEAGESAIFHFSFILNQRETFTVI